MKNERERASLIVEASFVVTIMIVFVAILINIGFVVYEKMLMDSAANRAAIGAAQVYGSTYRDPIYGYIDDSEFYKTDLYRYTIFFQASRREAGEKKAEWVGLYSLKSSRIAAGEEPRASAEVVKKPGTVLQHQIVIHLTEEFDMPLAKVLGPTYKIKYTAIGRADCVDLLDYFNTVSMLNTEIGSVVDKFFAHFNKFIGFFSLK